MQSPDSDPLQHGNFFEYKGHQRLESPLQSQPLLKTNLSLLAGKKSINEPSFADFCKNTSSPYLLEIIRGVHHAMFVDKQCLRTINYSMIDLIGDLQISNELFHKFVFGDGIHDYVSMVRLSECNYQLALVYSTRVWIVKPGDFITKLWDSEPKIEAEFALSEGSYVYLEWPPLNRDFLDNPYFLTLDIRGNLRVHYVKGNAEEIIEHSEGGGFYSATFSLNGGFIYAINKKQEICKLDFRASKVMIQRRIEGLSNMKSLHIKQLAPWMFTIGSVEDNGANSKSYLHVISGDLSDLEEEVKIKLFEIPILSYSAENTTIFRSLYVKEMQLLLCGHSRSNKVLALYFGSDGSIAEIDGLNLQKGLLRGMILVKEDISGRFARKESGLPVRYCNKQVKINVSLKFLILDSDSCLHHFNYFDTRLSSPAFSMKVRVVLLANFFAKEKFIEKKLLVKKKRGRCKSVLNFKNAGKVWENKKVNRNYSCGKQIEDITTSRTPLQLKAKKRIETPAFANLLKSQDKPLFSLQTHKIEESDQKPVNNPFLSTGSSLFSSGKTTTNSNSLFGSVINSKPNFAFEKKISKTESLFSQVNSKPKILDASSNLFSSIAQPKTFLKVFTTSEDPTKKKALLFLNKLESDVLFSVEDQEFPAHKYILSEKCKFFKNMFASGMLESYSSVIRVPELKASVFKAFLEYVYKGQTLLTEELAYNLIDLSERYIIHEMKVACENFLQNVLSLGNCCKMIKMAYFYEADLLKKWTLFFFQINFDKIMERKEFRDLPKMICMDIYKMKWSEKVILGPPLSELVVSRDRLKSPEKLLKGKIF